MKPKYLVGALAALALIVTAVVTVQSKKIEYMDFHTAASRGSKAQIAGTWVKDQGCRYDPDRNEFSFSMRDEKGTVMPVVLEGAKPNNFEIALTVVATGRVDGNSFHASHLLTKCPSKYDSGPPPVTDNGTRMN